MQSSALTGRTRVSTAVVACAAFSVVGLTACGSDSAGTGTGADVEDVTEDDIASPGPFDGAYDADLYDEVDSYVGEEVTLSADVNEVLSSGAFTIAGTDDTTVEALMVVGATGDIDPAPETTVEVTGTVQQAFDVATVEEDLGADLDDTLFEDYGSEPYVVADGVGVLENAEG